MENHWIVFKVPKKNCLQHFIVLRKDFSDNCKWLNDVHNQTLIQQIQSRFLLLNNQSLQKFEIAFVSFLGVGVAIKIKNFVVQL